MLRSIKDLKGLKVEAVDGEMGSVHDVLIDADGWFMRYAVVDTGGWLFGRKVLIAPEAVVWGDTGGHLSLNITKQQVKDSPDVATDPPLSQESLSRYHDYYHWPFAWGGTTGAGNFIGVEPAAMLVGDTELHPSPPPPPEHGESLLFMAHELVGYKIRGDPEGGEVQDLILDTDSGKVPTFLIAVDGRTVLLPSEYVRDAHLDDKTIDLAVGHEAVAGAPEHRTSETSADEITAAHEHYHRLAS